MSPRSTKGRWTMIIALAILLLAIALGAVGQICLKAGISQLGFKPPPPKVLASIFTNIWVFMGFFCYGTSSLFYIVALSRLDLSYAYPMIALGYVMVTFLAWRFLHEVVPGLRLAGLAIILIGVTVMAMSYRTGASAEAVQPQAIQAEPR